MRDDDRITRKTTGNQALSVLHWYFGLLTTKDYARTIQGILERSLCEFALKQAGLAQYFQLTFHVPPDDYEWANSHPFKRRVMDAVAHLTPNRGEVTLQVVVEMVLPQGPKGVGINNCYFKQEQSLLHDELRFRSKGEIAIYDELKRRDVLILPNPAVVMGRSAAEYGAAVLKREPDFLVCYKGKWGIMEINGDDFHSGVFQTTKDHDRARLFQHYGLFFIQSFDLKRCKCDPVGVVDEFLKLLANQKG